MIRNMRVAQRDLFTGNAGFGMEPTQTQAMADAACARIAEWVARSAGQHKRAIRSAFRDAGLLDRDAVVVGDVLPDDRARRLGKHLRVYDQLGNVSVQAASSTWVHI